MNENSIPQSAVSIYGQQDALDDFPVLKAFQQYIDAEQNKARKRMVVLCAFFAFLMSLVIVVFSVILHRVSDRNQQLNDKLLDYVMQGRTTQPTTIVQSPAPAQNDFALKAMIDELKTLQKQFTELEEKRHQSEQTEKPTITPPAATPTPEQLAMRKKLDEEAAKLKKAAEMLKAEQETLAAEKEKIRRQEVELHRRKLYPEHYGEKAPVKKEAENKAARPVISAAPVKTVARPTNAAGAIDYFSAYAGEQESVGKGELSDEELDDLIDALPKHNPAPTAEEALAPPKKVSGTGMRKNQNNDAFSVSVDDSAGDWLVPLK
jgi:hypothetical protein